MLVSAGVGSIFIAAMVSLYAYSMRSFGAMANYADFNRRSRTASDFLSRDIRCAPSVVSMTNNQIVLSASDGTNISYTYDSTSRTVTRVKGNDSRVLLRNVAWVAFALYQAPATNAAYNVFSTATAASAKLVGFQWSCAQLLVGPESNSEDVQTAIVSMRNR